MRTSRFDRRSPLRGRQYLLRQKTDPRGRSESGPSRRRQFAAQGRRGRAACPLMKMLTGLPGLPAGSATFAPFRIRECCCPWDAFLLGVVFEQHFMVPEPCPTFIRQPRRVLHSSRLRGLQVPRSRSRLPTLATWIRSGTAGTTMTPPSGVGSPGRLTIPANAMPSRNARRQGRNPCIRDVAALYPQL